jgi:phosphatidylserine/phosphatidylglycerophosphate/cardiolipin synthase-like enzyme
MNYKKKIFIKIGSFSCFIITTILLALAQGEYQRFDQKPFAKESVNQESTTIDQWIKQIQKKDTISVLFSPDDPIAQILVYLIEKEQTKINIAIFTFTDSLISNELIHAIERGVTVEIIGDRSSILDQYNKFDQLYEHGATIYCYNSQWAGRKRNSIMHHKFILFYNTLEKEAVVWTGSFNFTKAARQVNQENAVIIKRKEIIKRFEQQFQILKARSYYYKPCFISHTG